MDDDEQEEGREMNESITQYLRGWLSYEGYNRFSEAWYIADRIDARFTHELEAKQEEVDGLRSDNADLQAWLDASIPLPLDADGVVIRPGDMVCDKVHGTFQACEVGYLDDGRVKVYQDDHVWAMAGAVRHAPKPETIEDARKSKDDLVAFLAQSGVMGWKDLNSFAVDFSAVLERAYECGMRDSCARGGYADPSVLGGDAS